MFEHLGVLVRRGDDRREGVVLSGAAYERRSADVYVLDRFFVGHAGLGHGGGEGIQVHHDQFEGQNAVIRERLHIVRVVVSAENAAVDLRMERLYAAVHHFGKAGVVGDVAHREAEPFDKLARAAGAEEFDAARREPASKHVETRFITHADQSPTNRRIHAHP